MRRHEFLGSPESPDKSMADEEILRRMGALGYADTQVVYLEGRPIVPAVPFPGENGIYPSGVPMSSYAWGRILND